MTKPLSELRSYRELHSLSQGALAEKLGITNAALSRYESGDRTPRKDIAVKIARLTGVSILTLMGIIE